MPDMVKTGIRAGGYTVTSEDLINHPKHYQGSRFEVIDIVEAYRLGYHLGQAFAYIARHKKKNGRQDIEKAAWYLRRIAGNKNALAAQIHAWTPGFRFGIAGVHQDEIVSDFDIGNFAIESAIGAILASANSEMQIDLIHLARDHLESYLAATA